MLSLEHGLFVGTSSGTEIWFWFQNIPEISATAWYTCSVWYLGVSAESSGKVMKLDQWHSGICWVCLCVCVCVCQFDFLKNIFGYIGISTSEPHQLHFPQAMCHFSLVDKHRKLMYQLWNLRHTQTQNTDTRLFCHLSLSRSLTLPIPQSLQHVPLFAGCPALKVNKHTDTHF